MGLGTSRRTPPAVSVFAFALAAFVSIAAPAAARAPASGAGAIDARETRRTDLYREATEAAGAGRWAEAKELLRAALAIRSSPKVLFSLAQTEEQLGQLASAQADYERALEAAALEGKGDVVQSAGLAVRALSARVPHVRVVLSGAGAGGSATLDDQPVTLGSPVALDPGDHRVAVSAPGARGAILSVKVSEGEQLDVPISLAPDLPARRVPLSPASPPPPLPLPAPPVEPPASSEAPRSTGSPLRTLGPVTVGIGILAMGVGAAFGVESMGKHDDAERVCPGATCSPSGASLWHDAVTFGDVSTIAFIVGGAALVAGTVFWIAAPRSRSDGTRVGFGLGSVQLRGAW
jgi:hypothetical protein